MPEGLLIDDKPLVQVLSKDDVEAGRFYFDHAGARIYFADDPTGRKVEATVAVFAFESRASNVVIRNVTIEKYASVAQKGAINTCWLSARRVRAKRDRVPGAVTAKLQRQSA